jgi:Xaa-Pro aminopeptidase
MNFYELRRANLFRDQKADGLDCLLISHPTNIRYLTGFTGSSAFVVVTPKSCLILSDGRYEQQLAEECPDLDVHIRPHNVLQLDDLATQLNKHGNRIVGFEATQMTVATLEQLKDKATKSTFVSTQGKVEALRAKKDASEVQAIRHAISVAEKAFKMFIAMMQAESTEIELHNGLDHYLRLAGAKKSAFDPIVAFGERGALPHAQPTDRPLSEATKLLVDWGADCGYRSDITRSLKSPYPASPSRKSRQERMGYDFDTIYEAVLAAHHAAVAELRVGAKVKDVDTAARKAMSKKSPRDLDLSTTFNHGLGHGLGLETHEAPFLRQSSDTVLEAGNVITIEPGAYIQGWGGIRIEDDYLITKDGPVKLTTLPHDPGALS